MGMAQEVDPIPDTHGLPEFFVTDVRAEIIGANVRLFAGSRRGNQVQWLYSVVLPSEALMRIGIQCQQAAEEAFNLAQLMMRRTGH